MDLSYGTARFLFYGAKYLKESASSAKKHATQGSGIIYIFVYFQYFLSFLTFCRKIRNMTHPFKLLRSIKGVHVIQLLRASLQRHRCHQLSSE